MTEMRAVTPVDTRLVSLECYRFGFLRVDNKVNVVLRDRTTMRQSLHLIQIGQDECDFFPALNSEFAWGDDRRLRGKMDRDFVTSLAFDTGILCIFRGEREVINVVDLACLYQ